MPIFLKVANKVAFRVSGRTAGADGHIHPFDFGLTCKRLTSAQLSAILTPAKKPALPALDAAADATTDTATDAATAAAVAPAPDATATLYRPDVPIDDLLADLIQDWRDVKGEDGAQAPYSLHAWQQLMQAYPGLTGLVWQTYLTEVAVRAKN